MSHTQTTEAWVLHEGEGLPEPAELKYELFSFPGIRDDEVLVEPLYGSWEGNMSHAVERSPIDICTARGEPKVVIGNSGVVRAVEVGDAVSHIRPGDCCLFSGIAVADAHGYTMLAHGYDAPGTIGLLAKQTKVLGSELHPIPRDTRYSLPQWAIFSLRYMTAWSNWNVAFACYRAQLSEEDVPSPHVWGWGGGCTLAELDLAQRNGCRSTMISGTSENLQQIRSLGIGAVDRREFPDLVFDEKAYRHDEEYRAAYRDSERRFLQVVRDATDGEGVSIFVDYIGSPMARPTQKALGRLGVITTAGWKHGLSTPLNRASECIARHIYVHTHAWRQSDVAPAVAYAEAEGWMPDVEGQKIYDFDDVPKLVAEYQSGSAGYFPLFAVNA